MRQAIAATLLHDAPLPFFDAPAALLPRVADRRKHYRRRYRMTHALHSFEAYGTDMMIGFSIHTALLLNIRGADARFFRRWRCARRAIRRCSTLDACGATAVRRRPS